MKNFKINLITLFIAALTVLGSSCTRESVPVKTNDDARYISANVSSSAMSKGRALDALPDNFTLFAAVLDDSYEWNYAVNETMTKQNSVWLSGRKYPTFGVDKTIYYCAFYPGGTGPFNPELLDPDTKSSYPEFQNTLGFARVSVPENVDEQDDVICASFLSEGTPQAVQMQFEHILSAIDFNFSEYGAFDGSIKSIEITGIASSGIYSFEDGFTQQLNEYDGIAYLDFCSDNRNPGTGLPVTEEMGGQAITTKNDAFFIIPQTCGPSKDNESQSQILVRVEDRDGNEKLMTGLLRGIKFEPGIEYTLSLNLSDYESGNIVIDNISCQDWINDPGQYALSCVMEYNGHMAGEDWFSFPQMTFSSGLELVVDWGDGSSDSITKIKNLPGDFRLKHYYENEGDYKVDFYARNGGIYFTLKKTNEIGRYCIMDEDIVRMTIESSPTVAPLKFTASEEQSVKLMGAYLHTLYKWYDIDPFGEITDDDLTDIKADFYDEIFDVIDEIEGEESGLEFYFEYSYDDDIWTEWDGSELTFGTAKRPSVYIRGNNPDGINHLVSDLGDYSNGYESIVYGRAFAFKNKVETECEGNIMSLINPEEPLSVIPEGSGFGSLFLAEPLVSAPELPATTLTGWCYSSMFEGTRLKTAPALPAKRLKPHCYEGLFYRTFIEMAPELPATDLSDCPSCYSGMFARCSLLETAPALPAKKLSDLCYESMFAGCENLRSAPVLPATTLEWQCYTSMFSRCYSLEDAPELPATELASACYWEMFSGCTSLINAPELPATTLATDCYNSMFCECTSLVNAPDLPATTLADWCYCGMFYGCTSLVDAPELPAATLPHGCYSEMFSECYNLSYIKCLALEPYDDCWVYYVAPTGTFIKNPTAEWPVCDDGYGIPEGWVILDSED